MSISMGLRMKKQKKQAEPEHFGFTTPMPDVVNCCGDMLTKRSVSLTHITQKGEKLFRIHSTVNFGNSPISHQLYVRPDTLDAVVKMYYEHRGTSAIEMDIRYGEFAKEKKKKRSKKS